MCGAVMAAYSSWRRLSRMLKKAKRTAGILFYSTRISPEAISRCVSVRRSISSLRKFLENNISMKIRTYL